MSFKPGQVWDCPFFGVGVFAVLHRDSSFAHSEWWVVFNLMSSEIMRVHESSYTSWKFIT